MQQQTLMPRTFVDEALQCGQTAGVDIALLLEELGIARDTLDRLTAAQFGSIWLALSQRMRDEFFGLGDRPMRPGSFTLMGHATRNAPNLQAAAARALRFLTIVLDEPAGALTTENGLAVIRLAETGGPRSAFAYRVYFTILHSLNCWLIAERIPIRHMQFPCAEPAGTNDYGDFFGVPVRFGAAQAAMAFEQRYLRKRVNRSETALKAFLASAPAAFLTGYRHDHGIKAQIVAQLSTSSTESWAGIDEIAGGLGMSTSTLHRRLKQEGQSFGEIKEERRRNLALSLLRKSDIPVSQVALRVGYAEPSAFFRAFQRWFATTPGAIRGSD